MSDMQAIPAISQTENLIVLRRPVKQPAHTIYQEDLEEYLLLTRLMREAEKAWKKKRSDIKSALRAGARIEPGVHVAVLEADQRNGYVVAPCSSFKLVVR